MKAYETLTTVEPQGDVRIAGVPFAPGTEVEVTISPKRKSPEEFLQAWQLVCGQLWKRPEIQSLSDADIQREIDEYRAGR
jgi:hypothetical protein